MTPQLKEIGTLRKEDKDSSEMISQLLFGETCEIINQKNNWSFVKCIHDNYEGWLDTKQITEIKTDLNSKHTAFELVHNYVFKENHIPIVIGSSLPKYDGLNFKLKNVLGEVYMNNIHVTADKNISGACVVGIGANNRHYSERSFVTFDISNPEVAL